MMSATNHRAGGIGAGKLPPQRPIAVWTEGVCEDGAAILCDGAPVQIEKVIEALNHRESLRAAWTRLPLQIEHALPPYAYCEAKVAAGEASELERFIWDNEPMDAAWRASLAAVLSEAVEEDRASCMPEYRRGG